MSKEIHKVENYVNELFQKISLLNGKVAGQNGQSVKTRLGKDEKEAYINKAADEFMLKKVVESPPNELKIKSTDIIKEIVKREIEDTLR